MEQLSIVKYESQKQNSLMERNSKYILYSVFLAKAINFIDMYIHISLILKILIEKAFFWDKMSINIMTSYLFYSTYV